MAALIDAGHEINTLTLNNELERQGELARVGGFAGLVEILSAEEVGRPARLTEILTEKLRRRNIIRIGAQLVREAAEDVERDSADMIGQAMADLGLISRNGRRDEVSSWLEIIEMAGNREPFRDGSGERGGWWGIQSLDDAAPIPAGQVTFVGARPGVGKTALATQIVCESAIQGRHPLLVQLELPKKTSQARVASYFAKVSTRALKEGTYTASVSDALREHNESLASGGILSPRGGTLWSHIEASIAESIERRGTDLVVIDYFSLIGRPQVARGGNEAYAYAKVSEAITAFAKDHQGVGVVLLGQLKADAADREPKDGDTADSDRPARDAAVSLMLWRDGKDQTWGALRKNRDGKLPWKHGLDFQGWCQRFQISDPFPSPSTHSGESY
jgi:replicative DNA helicase